eukprot:scaffold27952_cov52-Phaeocystis_antarctica.AAC.2
MTPAMLPSYHPCTYRCEAQLDLEWEDEAASATFLFQPANVVSQPRLRCGRKPHRARTLDSQTPDRSATHTCEPRLGQGRGCAARYTCSGSGIPTWPTPTTSAAYASASSRRLTPPPPWSP